MAPIRWVFVFELDTSGATWICPVIIKSRIRVGATDLIKHAFVTVPRNMLHWDSADVKSFLLSVKRSRVLGASAPKELVVQRPVNQRRQTKKLLVLRSTPSSESHRP
jgi:hypothetical protein